MSCIETQILRAAFASQKNLERILARGVTSLHFQDQAKREIFAIIASAYNHGQSYSPEYIAEEHPKYAAALCDFFGAVWVLNLDPIIDEIKDREWGRLVEQKTSEFHRNLAAQEKKDRQTILDHFSALASVVESRDEMPSGGCGSEVFFKAYQEIEDTYLARKSGKAVGVPTGIPSLDRALSGGLKPCELAAIGALTGKGKTHIGVSLVMNALRAGLRACYVTIEMSDTVIMKRMIANESGVNSKILSAGTFDDYTKEAQFDAVANAGVAFRKDRLFIESDTRGVFERLESVMHRYGRSQRIDLLVIDYIQQFYYQKPMQSRVSELNQITAQVKNITKQYGYATVMLAQLNREAQKEKERGRAHGSHQFEQSHSMAKDSDIILILDEESLGGQEFLYLAKNRNGEDGLRFPITLDRRISRITEGRK